MKDLMNAKLFLKNIMPWCAAYNFSKSSKNNPKKPYLLLQKVSVTENHRYMLFNPKRDCHPCKVSILMSDILSTEHCFNIMVLLCTAKTQRVQSQIGTLASTDLMSSYCILDRVGSTISAASTEAAIRKCS